jgi:hypothetical protein
MDGGGSPLATDVSDVDGTFTFGEIEPGTYTLEVDIPAGHTVTAADQVPAGVDPEVADETDSDLAIVDEQAGTARTAAIEVADQPVNDLGLGLVPVPSEPPTSSSSVVASTTTAPPTTTVAEPSTTSEPATTTTQPATTTTTTATTTSVPPTAPPTEPPTTVAPTSTGPAA